MKRLVLAAALALALHALLLSARVKWLKEYSLLPTPPIRLSLSYRTPESREIPSPPPIEPTEKAPDPPALEKPKEPERDPVREREQPHPKRRPSQKPPEQKPVPEIRKAAEAVEAKPVTRETTETAPPVEMPASISSASIKPMPADMSHSFLPPPKPGAEPPPAQSRQAVPLYLKNPPPEYPPAARRRGYEGTVMMEVFVDREGKVRDLRLVQSSGHAMLDRAAMRAVKGWRFEPARQGEEKVEMWVKVPLTFRLKE